MRAALQLDFVASRRRGRAPGYAVLAFSLALAGTMLWKFTEVQQQLRRIEAAEAMLAAPRAVQRQRPEAEIRGAQAAVRQLALPWGELIDSLERASTREVALLTIQPDAQNRLLRLTAETRQQELMLEYLRRLNATGSFADVHLLSHQVREDDPRRPLHFSVQAAFRSAR